MSDGRLVAQLRVCRYLLTKADSRNLSHGQKHFFIQTVLHVLMDVENAEHNTQPYFQESPEVGALRGGDIDGIPF